MFSILMLAYKTIKARTHTSIFQSLPMKLQWLTFIIFLCFPCFHVTLSKSQNYYTSIFSFGDSLADTGNMLLSGALPFPSISHLPYGMTYFHHPTGRCSDGRLIVDFIAEALGLPCLPPYLDHGRSFKQGANFAFSGATALEPEFFQNKGLGRILWTNASLSAQLKWFEELKPSLCSSIKECNEYFSKSLFLVGEIGGNDYNYAFFLGKSMTEVKSYVPKVIKAIITSAERLINHGVVHLVVPGNLPIGCSAMYLTLYHTPNKAAYENGNGCLKAFNGFAKYHNSLLRQSLETLRHKYPQARIMYADYYGAAIPFVHSPKHFGFSKGALLTCCGGGGLYNFNISARCGHPGSSACDDPSSYVNWDGIHLTEAAYAHISAALLNGTHSEPSILGINLN
ncbi:putative carboxylesterase [Dioscorea sansibarensis]